LNTDASAIKIGVAGWSYADWNGVVYSPREARGPGALAVIARLFDCVEINSSFYRYPASSSAEKWLRTVESHPEFCFTAKVTRTLTHEARVDQETIRAGARQLVDGLRPLIDSGRLETLLAQFPPFFRDGPAARARIEAIVEALRPIPTSVEIRHASFLSTSFLQFLERLDASFVNVDLPPGRDPFPTTAINTASIAYVRLHGRNSEAWFDRDAGRDAKYNYYYSREELEPWATRIREIAARTHRLYVITNNHFQGQAPANALDLMKLLDRELPPVPPGLLALYPGLRRDHRDG
jgi:uncharacterized protein YecE (DUF72 family)